MVAVVSGRGQAGVPVPLEANGRNIEGHDEDGGGVATRSPGMFDYCVAGTKIGAAVLFQPFISILPSGRAVPVIMPVVLKGVATLP